MSILDVGVLIAAFMNVIMHETAHAITARRLGGRWLGLRWRAGRLSTAIDITGLSVRAHRRIAVAGLMVDMIMASISILLWVCLGCMWAKGAVIWTTASVLVNGCPWIPHSDGWQIIFGVRFIVSSTDQDQHPHPALLEKPLAHD